jgi:hypothetical protein
MKDSLKAWLEKANLGDNQKKLVEFLNENVKDDEDAGLVHTLLNKIKEEKK